MIPIPFLNRSRTFAPPGYNRWFVPPAALSIHLAIGQVYAFSVFKNPLGRAIGITAPAEGDWSAPTLAWIFSLAIVMLGLSAAVFGKWLEAAGPRKAMFASACCFGGGWLVAALGVSLHQIWLVYLGYGFLGGIGLGIGYISPVSTLIKWFPDRPGMATGMAIMGFGGGAMIGSPLADELMAGYRTPTSVGVVETFLTMGGLYFTFMLFGVVTVRLPQPGWTPPGYVPPEKQVGEGDYLVGRAVRTRSFWLLWAVLFLNVTAGIGILEHASPMIQDLFPGAVSAAAAAGFVGLLSLFNMAGRFAWSSLSDRIGRKATYAVYFLAGGALYALLPATRHLGSPVAFVAASAVIMSMYGGGFATIPAYLRDLFGTAHVGAIHGRLLTAWSCAGIAGPMLVNHLRDDRRAAGVPPDAAYDFTLYLMAGLLLVGAVCNALIRGGQRRVPGAGQSARVPVGGAAHAVSLPLVLSWIWVGVPLAWGIYRTIVKATALFQ